MEAKRYFQRLSKFTFKRPLLQYLLKDLLQKNNEYYCDNTERIALFPESRAMLVNTSCLYHNWLRASRPCSAAVTSGPLNLVFVLDLELDRDQYLNTPPWSCLKDSLAYFSSSLGGSCLHSGSPNHIPENSHLETAWLGHPSTLASFPPSVLPTPSPSR